LDGCPVRLRESWWSKMAKFRPASAPQADSGIIDFVMLRFRPVENV